MLGMDFACPLQDLWGCIPARSPCVSPYNCPYPVAAAALLLSGLQLQFNMRGPGGVAIVNADMFKDSSGSWDYMYLIVDVKSGQSPPQRLNIVPPKLVPVS